ncbi:cytochrome P450 [Isoptericola sp. S6320L]|uniref:cytochrome P450 n=1 Tax=Isoptericola sp. S6320L TaxID=2926411 RepID=UPI001FF4C2AA|nr:cytochrome P450 [Isoptericola sp. S6320L]MCK0117182.1 cytochrome P450 [Isoptericola sp. S6320L]
MSGEPVDLSVAETASVLRSVIAPFVAQGAIVRRPRATAWAERHQTDRGAREVLAALRARYDGAPLSMRLGPRRMVVVTRPDQVRRLLQGSPDPYSPASLEKRGALKHFQPDGVLVSGHDERRVRRPLNEAALDADQAVHRNGRTVVDTVERGARELENQVRATGGLDAQQFARTWWSMVLEIVFGERARDDLGLVDLLDRLKRDANWSGLHPRRTRRRAELEQRIATHVREAAPDSLAGVGREVDAGAVAGQVPHWLFAFDAAAATTLRALAVATARQEVRERLRDELASADPEGPPAVLPYARACALEAVRLWPTTFAVLRDSVRATDWDGRTLPAGTGFVVVSSFFHRDPQRLDVADRFVPEVWLDGRADEDWGLVPFSGGPASCPGRNLVLLVTSHLLVRLAGLDLRVQRARYLADDPVPATVDHLGVVFRGRR